MNRRGFVAVLSGLVVSAFRPQPPITLNIGRVVRVVEYPYFTSEDVWVLAGDTLLVPRRQQAPNSENQT